MNTTYLNYALEIERVGSISQAAQNLYMAQPNLSKAIRELEKELGFAIFKRTAKGVSSTEEGTEFLYHARQITEQVGAVERISQRIGTDKLKYKISIPRGSYIVDGFTSFLSELELEKGMEVTINETNALGTISNVADRGYNLGIIRYQMLDETQYLTMLKNNHLTYETIWEFEYVLVMSKNHPLANKETITPGDLSEYTKITHGDIELPHVRRINHEAEMTPRNVIYVYERGSQFDLLGNINNTYMWVSPVPKSCLEQHGMVQLKCDAPYKVNKDVLIFPKGYSLSKLDEQFIAELERVKEKIKMDGLY